jgi:hypothetical protein
MAKPKRGEKTQAIRDYLATNPKAGPKDVVAGLQAQGMAVKPGLVSAIKYGKQRGKPKPGRRGRAPAMSAAARHTSNGDLTVDLLVEVRQFVSKVGDVSTVRKALDVLDMLR